MTISKILGQSITLQGFFCKDSSGNPCVDVTYTLNIVSGPVNGLSLVLFNGTPSTITTNALGTYEFNITATNPGGTLTTNSEGTSGGTDTAVVSAPAPNTMGWTNV